MTITVAKAPVQQNKVKAPQISRAKVVRNFPPLKVFDPAPDPLAGLPETGKIEQNTKEDMSAILKGFQEAMKRDQKRYEETVDSEYWCCFIFENREQKMAFLHGLKLDIQSVGDKYVDGRRVADALGIELPKATLRYNDGSRGNRTKRN